MQWTHLQCKSFGGFAFLLLPLFSLKRIQRNETIIEKTSEKSVSIATENIFTDFIILFFPIQYLSGADIQQRHHSFTIAI